MGKSCLILLSLAFAISFLVLYGCVKQSPTQDSKKSATNEIVDYVTGAAQARQYQKAKSTIEEINESRREQYKELE